MPTKEWLEYETARASDGHGRSPLRIWCTVLMCCAAGMELYQAVYMLEHGHMFGASAWYVLPFPDRAWVAGKEAALAITYLCIAWAIWPRSRSPQHTQPPQPVAYMRRDAEPTETNWQKDR